MDTGDLDDRERERSDRSRVVKVDLTEALTVLSGLLAAPVLSWLDLTKAANLNHIVKKSEPDLSDHFNLAYLSVDSVLLSRLV